MAERALLMSALEHSHRISKELHPVLEAADLLGWGSRALSSGGVQLVSPDGETRLHIPQGKQDSVLPTKLMVTLLRATDPGLPGVWRKGGMKALREAVNPGNIRDTAFGEMVFVPLPEEKEEVVAQVAPEVVEESPWMARVSSDGRKANLYPSDSVTVQKWSDGSVSYICPVCRKYTSDNPRSVAAHAGRHTAAGDKDPADTTPSEFDVEIDGYNTRRVASLAREITTALGAVERGSATLEQYGRALAEHIVDARPERTHEEAQPLSPEQVLARITSLVAAPVKKELEAERARRIEYEEAMTVMKQAQAKQQEDLRAMREMFAQVTGGL